MVSLDDVKQHQRLVIATQIAAGVERHILALIADGAAAVEMLSVQGRRID